jgi:F-type H+-transporting ATPase subunit delta
MADQSTIARPYAKALFDVANADQKLGSWSDALNAAAAVLGDANAKRVLGNPALDQGKRADLLDTAQVKALLALLAENDRLAVLPEIAAQFDALKAEAENKVKAKLVSATAVDAAVAARVKQALEKRLGREVELTLEVDPSLIGGAIVRAEDMVIDGSVRTRLEQLARAMVS